MKLIEAAQLKAWIDADKAFQLIDTRDPDKYKKDHIKNAISIPQFQLPEMLGAIDDSATVVIYCMYGIKSEQVYIFLKDKLKVKDLYILDGGIYKYSTEIDPSMDV